MDFHPMAFFVALPIVILTAALVYMIRTASLQGESKKTRRVNHRRPLKEHVSWAIG